MNVSLPTEQLSCAPVSTTPSDSGPVQQYDLLQVLRGFSAVWVVLFHTYMFGCIPHLSEALPQIVRLCLFDWGRGGVGVFFVLSGFVIAHSLRDKIITSRVAGLFILKRSIRLDPPYWFSILVALSIAYVSSQRHEGMGYILSGYDILLHVLYLQDLFHGHSIQSVYWTLAYEFQFYIVYIALRASLHRWTAPLFSRALLTAAYLAALIGAAVPVEWVTHGLFLNYWYAFAVGCIVYYSGVQKASVIYALPIILAMLISAPFTQEVFNTPASLAAILLWVVSRTNTISRKISAVFLKRLGSVSYSLYLIHIPVITVLMSMGKGWQRTSWLEDTAFLTIIMAVCVTSSLIMWLFIERPAHRWSRSIGVD